MPKGELVLVVIVVWQRLEGIVPCSNCSHRSRQEQFEGSCLSLTVLPVNLPKVIQYTGRLVRTCWYVGELIVSNYVALSINNRLQDVSATKAFVSCMQNVAQELLTINLPTLKSVAINLNNIIYWYVYHSWYAVH